MKMLTVTLQRKRSESPARPSHLTLTIPPPTPARRREEALLCPRPSVVRFMFSSWEATARSSTRYMTVAGAGGGAEDSPCGFPGGPGDSKWTSESFLAPLFLNQLQKETGQKKLGTAQSWVCGAVGVTNLTTLFLFLSRHLFNWENSYKTGLQFPYRKEKGPPQGRSCHRWKDRGTHASS